MDEMIVTTKGKNATWQTVAQAVAYVETVLGASKLLRGQPEAPP